MAKTITIEFTDAQWELIKEHYPTQYYDDPEDLSTLSVWTEVLLANWFKEVVHREVNSQIQIKASHTDSFNV